MPYIQPQERRAYDQLIESLAAALSELPPDQRKGHANYVITQIMRRAWSVHEAEGESYANYADVIGTLECAKLELYRHFVGPYEDEAIVRNGDL